ncbi:MAG: putative bifunctional diguanylate cyclase/phosphodiesterase [Burkholderiales bacterium]
MTPEAIKLLFIEDSELDVELATRAIQKEGFDVAARRVELEADMRRALAEDPPHAILSDFSMPRFDGINALRVAREIAPLVPFIFVSGTIGEERAIEAIRLGATDYVLKNNMRRLGTAVRRALAEAEERARSMAAEEERARLVEILEATSDYVSMSDPDGRRTYLNAAGRRLTGIDGGKALSGHVNDSYPPWARDILIKDAQPEAERNGLWSGETAILDPQGDEIPVSQVVIAHRNAEGGIRFYSTIARDMRERKAYEARIQHLANYDALTDLPNRSLLGDRTAQAVAHARRFGRSVALVVLNLDRFKLVNDSGGHALGDELLRGVGERLPRVVREGDTVARLGADAFAVLAADLARVDDVVAVVRKIQQVLRPPFRVGDADVHVTASIGASVSPRDGEDFDVLLRNADAAVHRVKAEGRNAFHFYSADMTREAADRVRLEAELRRAMQKAELEMHFQPQVRLEDGLVVGVEALMRWHHAERGWISPAQFMPIAEESDLINDLGAFALSEGMRQVAQWTGAGGAGLRLAVNVSARQFRSVDFVDTVGQALLTSGLDPARLEIELTEGVLVEKQDEAIGILKRLKALGVQVAVDDFGTGYSSLSYLSWLPIDCLKIDRSFVHRIADRGRDTAIVQAIVSLAHSLNLRVIAEGVETPGQAQFLQEHHCDEVQGFLYSRPMRGDAIPALLGSGPLQRH